MVPFTFQRVVRDEEAIAAASRGGRFLAGGTTIVDLMREGIERPAALVDINRLPYRQVEASAEGLTIGALARMSDVASDRDVTAGYPAIAESLLASASPQLRNMASIGGNLLQRTRCLYFRDAGVACNKKQPASGCPARAGEHRSHAIFGTSEACIATHASDLAVALVAFDALLHIRGGDGDRRVPLSDLYRLPAATPHLEHAIAPDELVLAIHIPAGAHARRSHYLKVRDRASYEFALVSAAVGLDADGGIIRGARVAAGGVGTVPWRLRNVEDALIGRPNDAASWRAASERAVEGAVPLAQNRFKVDLLARTILRALEHVGGRM